MQIFMGGRQQSAVDHSSLITFRSRALYSINAMLQTTICYSHRFIFDNSGSPNKPGPRLNAPMNEPPTPGQ